MNVRLTDPGLALHAILVSGWLTEERLVGWEVREPGRVLAELSREGLVRMARTPRGELFALTDGGKRHAHAWYDGWLAGLPRADRNTLGLLLDSFEALDPQLKRVVSRYQQGGDQDGPAELSSLHREARGTVESLAAIGPQWASYPGRLDHAIRAVTRGDERYVASPLIDSYHTVWHLFHQDLRMTEDRHE
jgi:hypothetical protein